MYTISWACNIPPLGVMYAICFKCVGVGPCGSTDDPSVACEGNGNGEGVAGIVGDSKMGDPPFGMVLRADSL